MVWPIRTRMEIDLNGLNCRSWVGIDQEAGLVALQVGDLLNPKREAHRSGRAELKFDVIEPALRASNLTIPATEGHSHRA